MNYDFQLGKPDDDYAILGYHIGQDQGQDGCIKIEHGFVC